MTVYTLPHVIVSPMGSFSPMNFTAASFNINP